MRIRDIVLMTIALPMLGCATAQNNRVVSQGVVLANSMCARHGVAAASNDPKGDRMICELEELVGSHVPRCVCRDEQQLVADRDASQEYVREIEHGRCISNGSGTCH
jgi:hypothetical protein